MASLVIVTLVAFGSLASAIDGQGEQAGLPVFLNPTPGRVERLANALVAQLLDGASEADSARAASRLARLGGAGLPAILPHLDSLPPSARASVALALEPVRRRMGFEPSQSGEVARTIQFWGRFWEEHAIDFRPVVAQRVVERLAMRETALRRAELRRLDTYALDALLVAMDRLWRADNFEGLERLTRQAASIAGLPELAVLPGESEADVSDKLVRWAEWWQRNRFLYKSYRGSERIGAMLRDTRYGDWVTQLVRGDFGLDSEGLPVSLELLRALAVTVPLLLAGLIGLAMARRRVQRVVVWSERVDIAPPSYAQRLLQVGVPLPLLLIAFARQGALAGGVAVGASCVFFTMLLAGRAAWLQPLSGGSAGFYRLVLSWGIAPSAADRQARHGGAGGGQGRWVSLLFCTVCLVEHLLGLAGAGLRTLEAFHRRDLNWLMAIIFVSACGLAVLQFLVEVARSGRVHSRRPSWAGVA